MMSLACSSSPPAPATTSVNGTQASCIFRLHRRREIQPDLGLPGTQVLYASSQREPQHEQARLSKAIHVAPHQTQSVACRAHAQLHEQSLIWHVSTCE